MIGLQELKDKMEIALEEYRELEIELEEVTDRKETIEENMEQIEKRTEELEGLILDLKYKRYN